MLLRRSRIGFTLLETLMAMGILIMLVDITIIAVNPNKQLAKARDARRGIDVNTIINAVYEYSVDHNGLLPGDVPYDIPKFICAADAASCVNGVNLDALTGSYIIGIPTDPKFATGTGTHYTIVRSSDDYSITVAAPGAERTDQISAMR
jgi:type II secretory pathway pseudopilin PulG